MKKYIVSLAVSLLVLSSMVNAQVPQKISYQGLLTSSSGVPLQDGSYNLRFDIYNLPNGGALRHTETQNNVSVDRGIFSVVLRPPASIFSESLYVEVTALAGSPGVPVDITFSPRSELTSAPYALAPWITNGSDISYNLGNVGIGTTTPSEQLEITGNFSLPTTTETTGVIKVGGDYFIHSYGISNTFVGWRAGNLSMSGFDNTANGCVALMNNTSGYGNTAIGFAVLMNNTTGIFNTGTGYQALLLNTEGEYNTADGHEALTHNITGYFNTAIGMWALEYNTEGYYNTAIGGMALDWNTTGYLNTAGGHSALATNRTGNYNTANGADALYNNTVSYNTATGYRSLYSNSIGDYNTAAGYQSLFTNTTGIRNTVLGAMADVSVGNLTNATAIGYGAIVNASNKVRIGNGGVTIIEGQVAWSWPSDYRIKEDIIDSDLGLDFINRLRPVSFKMKNVANDKINYGFIAQEVETALEGRDANMVLTGDDPDKMKTMRYTELIAPLVKAIQEQQKQIDELKAVIKSFAQENKEKGIKTVGELR